MPASEICPTRYLFFVNCHGWARGGKFGHEHKEYNMADGPDGLINEFEAAEHMGVKVGTMRKYRQSGNGPKFIRLSPRCIRYRRDWLDEHAAARTFTST